MAGGFGLWTLFNQPNHDSSVTRNPWLPALLKKNPKPPSGVIRSGLPKKTNLSIFKQLAPSFSESFLHLEAWWKKDKLSGTIIVLGSHSIVGGPEMRFRFIPYDHIDGTYIKAPDESFHHYAAVCDFQQGENRFYQDGKLVGTKPITDLQKEKALSKTAMQFKLGPPLLGGWIGETRVSSVARYDGVYFEPKSFTSDKHTVALYKMTGDTPVLIDSSGNELHGVLGESISREYELDKGL